MTQLEGEPGEATGAQGLFVAARSNTGTDEAPASGGAGFTVILS